MSNTMAINDFLVSVGRGDFDDPDVSVQIRAGWFDWFCPNDELAGRTKNLAKKIIQICATKRFDWTTSRVIFKNNLPVFGKGYDEFRIIDIKSGDLIFTVVPCSEVRQERGMAMVWGYRGEGTDREFGLLIQGSWDDVVRWFEEG
jgi:hypothetical protein